MRETITLSLPAELRSKLDRIASEDGVSRSDIIRESLRDLLFLREFRALRQRLSGKARRRGIFSDEDVFDRVS
jgi:metal-responsive CopG/Arc/MetJ family transcriptional regulator